MLNPEFDRLFKYFIVFITGFIITVLLTPLFKKLAIRYNVLDMPGKRRVHDRPIPRSGGLAVVIGFYAACVLAIFYPWSHHFQMGMNWWWSYLTASSVLVLFGLLDDIKGVRAWTKLAGQVIAASIMISCGCRIGNVLGVELPMYLDFILSLCWYLIITNAFNLIDGLDGLATGLAAITALGLAASFMLRRMPGDALVLVGLIGTCMGFLVYNFHPASIFLGDTGSMFLGFTLASIPLATSAKATFITALGVPLLATGIPMFDTFLAIWRRAVRMLLPRHRRADTNEDTGIMKADAEHLHHRLMDSGLKQNSVAFVLYLINVVLVVTALLLVTFQSHTVAILLIAFIAGVYVVVRHLANVELWDTGVAIIQGINRPTRQMVASILYPVLDLVFLLLAQTTALLILYSRLPEYHIWTLILHHTPVWLAPSFICLCLSRAYSRVWSMARLRDYVVLSLSLVAGAAVGYAIMRISNLFPNEHLIVSSMLYLLLAWVGIMGSRISLRTAREFISWMIQHGAHHTAEQTIRTVIYGQPLDALLYVMKSEMEDPQNDHIHRIVGLIHDDPNLRKRYVYGYRVMGVRSDLPLLIETHQIQEIVVTRGATPEALTELTSIAEVHGINLVQWDISEKQIREGTGQA